jgi:chemotaxis protein MotB
MRKGRAHEGEHENGERWLLTYADMITLLMAFFIMLYSMSQIDLKKFSAMTGSVQAQLGGTGILEGSMNSEKGPELRSGSPGIMPSLSGQPAALKQALDRDLGALTAEAGLKISANADEVKLSLPATTLHFASGSAQPTKSMLRVLQRLAAVLSRIDCAVKVTGHTCNLPVQNTQYQSNWELSADRARNVAFLLIRYGGVSAKYCSFMGMADSQPLAPNDTEAHRALNRRVEITLKSRDGVRATSTHTRAVDISPHLDLQAPKDKEQR